MVNVDWNNINPGKKPVCIVGAGFQKAVLCEKLPSTEDIIEKTVKSQRNQFPILSILFDNKISCRFDLNYIWKNINDLSLELAHNYNLEIESKYSKLNNKTTQVIEDYKRHDATPQNILWVVLGLELKKMLAYQYKSTKIKGESYFKKCAIDNLKEITSKSEKFTWISLNYDIVLEQMLVYAIYNQKKLNRFCEEVKYSFDQLFGNLSIVDFKHLIIKPHGSLNVVFETYDQNSNNKIHSLYFTENDDYFTTFDCQKFGYDINDQNIITEKRPWLIGYLPDDMKDELNSRAYFSDLAHDLSKWNMASASFALENASSIFILGYSMPQEDEWVWARFRNIKKDIDIFVASRKSSKGIVKELKRNCFTNVNIINAGKI